MNDFDRLITMIRKAVREVYRYSVPRMGKVVSVNDIDQKGRIKVICESLGWMTEDQAAPAYPKGIRSYITPKVDDYVILEWIDGNRNKCVYSSIAYWMTDMKPGNYDNQNTTQVIFEDNKQKLSIVYDELLKVLSIDYNSEMYIKMDITNKKIEQNDSANTIVTDGNAGTITLQNQSGKKVELGVTSVDITGASGSFKVT